MNDPGYRLVTVTVEMDIKVPLGKAASMLVEAADVAGACVNGNVAQLEDWTVVSPDVDDIQKLDTEEVYFGDSHKPMGGIAIRVDEDNDPADWPVVDRVIGHEGEGVWRVVSGTDEFCVTWTGHCWSAV